MISEKNRQKILIVDDSEMNRSLLSDMLEDEYEIMEAADGDEAVTILSVHYTEIDLVLLDVIMPKMDGFCVLAMMQENQWIEDVPVIMISSESSSAFLEKAYALGATDYISRPFDVAVVHRRVVNTLLLYDKQKKLVDLVTEQIYEKEKSNRMMVNILSHIVEFRNGESGNHVLNINIITDLLLRRLVQMTDQYGLSMADIHLIAMASALHDVGKIAIPYKVLNKPGRFTDEEFAIMKTHSMQGAQVLEKVTLYKDEPLIRTAYEIARWHHERWDGRGYPDGLKGEEIPISAQVVSVADVYDALTSERVYKKAFSHEEALRMILNGECGAFNPVLMDCLKESAPQLRELLNKDTVMDDEQLDTVVEEIGMHEELSASGRTLQLLERERAKYQFFASISREIQFEYTVSPKMVRLMGPKVAEQGFPELIMDPENSEEIRGIVGEETMRTMSHVFYTSTPEQPVVEREFEVPEDGRVMRKKVIYRVEWSEEDEPQIIGAYGKVIPL